MGRTTLDASIGTTAPRGPELLVELGDAAAGTRGIRVESALREANQRFARRFGAIERAALESGKKIEEMSLDEMDALWEEAKRDEA